MNMFDEVIKDVKNIFFLGIGGIGMSALAKFFIREGYKVYGYDRISTGITDNLIKNGANIIFDDDVSKIDDKKIDMVVYTVAVPDSLNISRYLKKNCNKVYKRSEILGMLTEKFYTIAIAGSHGKTTVSSIISHILYESGFDIHCFVGGIMNNYGTNYIHSNGIKYMGKSILVVEADEFDMTFLQFYPDIEVITSIDSDHLDIYGNLKNIEEAFVKFTENLKKEGKIVINDNINGVKSRIKNNYETYSLSFTSDNYASDYIFEDNEIIFNYISKNNRINYIKTTLVGWHNIENCIAAITVANTLGVKENVIRESLNDYRGVRRRFEYIINNDKIVYIDDYAHHPSEIDATLKSLRKLYNNKKLTGVFQPHLFSRTRDLYVDFAKSLELLDVVILLDIYPAREEPIEGVSSEMIYNIINKKDKYLLMKEELLEYLNSNDVEVLITLGAGDIEQLVLPIKNTLVNKYKLD